MRLFLPCGSGVVHHRDRVGEAPRDSFAEPRRVYSGEGSKPIYKKEEQLLSDIMALDIQCVIFSRIEAQMP